MKIQLQHCEIEFTSTGAVTTWPDGKQWGALPHDVPHYHALAHRLGYEGDTLRYCQEHDLAHHLVCEYFGNRSAVLWALAHSRQPDAWDTASEEALALALQRYARTNEVPLVDRVDWKALKSRFHQVLGGHA